ncbi:MAG: sugar kinase, partial [Hymenobacter sp.]
KRAVIHGSAMASFCVEKFGTERLLNLTQEEIEAREAMFEELVKVQPAAVVENAR